MDEPRSAAATGRAVTPGRTQEPQPARCAIHPAHSSAGARLGGAKAPLISLRDHVTGLLDKPRFLDEARRRVAPGQPAAMLLFDLDGFADINDDLGHDTGDRVLAAVGARLRERADPEHPLARLGGDEFALLIPDTGDPRTVYTIARELLDTLHHGFRIDGELLRFDTSAGIAIAPHHGATVETLLMSAELALYQAKRDGGGTIGFFEPHLRRQLGERRLLQAELRRAFERDEFELLYQPQVDLRSRRIVGAEALLRWNHPVRGQLAPGQFLPVLDRMPLAEAVGAWVLRTAIAQAAAWFGNDRALRVGVNLFGAQFRSGNLADEVAANLREHQLPPRWLELELTETVAIKGSKWVMNALSAIRHQGVGVALDDFGTGFASLSLLKELPVSCLKVDKSFVRDIAINSRDAVLVDAIVRVGRTFGLNIIAEGIETAEQERWLIDANCREGQGYVYGKPMTSRRTEQLISGQRLGLVEQEQ